VVVAPSAAVAGAAVFRDGRALSDRHRGVCHRALLGTRTARSGTMSGSWRRAT
jgi:hypothetical protein